MSKQTGFTLVELLIVISIIAILSVIGLVAYGQFMKSSRDAKRQSDLKLIQSALEDYHADQLYYPSSGFFTATFNTPLNNTTGGLSTTVSKTYLNSVPKDPSNNQYYLYVGYKKDALGTVGCYGETGKGNCTSYCIYANREVTTVPASDQGCTNFPNKCGTTSSGADLPCNFGVTRP